MLFRSSGTSELSLAGIARGLGVPPSVASPLPLVVLLIGAVLIAVLRHHPRLAWSVAIATMVFGSPVVNVNWFTLLLAALAPLAWPGPPDSAVPVASAEGTIPTSTVG